MKKITSFLALLFFLQVNAQTINSVTVFPPNPTTSDNILILAECTFGYGSCNQHTQGYSIAGNSISSWAFHCLGMLTVICTDTDTFSVGMLPVGTYTVNFQLDEGNGPVPCTPGIVPGPNTNMTFTVSTPTEVSEAELISDFFNVYPNPVTSKLTISIPMHLEQRTIKSVTVFDVFGREVSNHQVAVNIPQPITIDVSYWNSGVYFLRITDEKTKRIVKVLKQ